MKLADWAKSQGISYLTAYRWFKKGKLPVSAYQTDTGTIIVDPTKENNMSRTSNKRRAIRQDAALSLFNDVARSFGNFFPELELGTYPQLVRSDRSRFKSLSQEDKYVLIGEIPGFSEDEVKITVKDSAITITGKHEMKESGENFFSEETASFHNSYSLPTDADIKGISAEHKHGVLQITVPKQSNGKEEIEIPIK